MENEKKRKEKKSSQSRKNKKKSQTCMAACPTPNPPHTHTYFFDDTRTHAHGSSVSQSVSFYSSFLLKIIISTDRYPLSLMHNCIIESPVSTLCFNSPTTTMIDCEVKYGAYVPTVPKIYQELAQAEDHSTNNNNNNNKTTSKSSSGGSTRCCDDDVNKYETEVARVSDCFIGPTWTPLPLIDVEPYNHDTSLFTFALPDPEAYLALPVTSHLLVRAPDPQNNCGGGYHVRPYTAIREDRRGQFTLLVKLYREWGIPEREQQQNHRVFLFAKTDHSYRPPGKVSSYIHHQLKVGDTLEFLHNRHCLGKIPFPFPTPSSSSSSSSSPPIRNLTLIAVGAGVAPMIRIVRALLEDDTNNNKDTTSGNEVRKIRLLYGVRTVSDILMRQDLDRWHEKHSDRFQVCYCIGSRYSNVHFHAKKQQPQPQQPLPRDWETVPDDRKELGWVDGDKVKRRGASTATDEGHRIFLCGLPGVYLRLAGSRFDDTVQEGTQLHELGYRDHQVIKF